jgi:hypothetical protein
VVLVVVLPQEHQQQVLAQVVREMLAEQVLCQAAHLLWVVEVAQGLLELLVLAQHQAQVVLVYLQALQVLACFTLEVEVVQEQGKAQVSVQEAMVEVVVEHLLALQQ